MSNPDQVRSSEMQTRITGSSEILVEDLIAGAPSIPVPCSISPERSPNSCRRRLHRKSK
jgi:hypothetical protein